MFDKPDICGECGGKCCKRYPGCTFPIDFGLKDGVEPDFTKLTEALNSGRWCIDWWEGDTSLKQEQTPAPLDRAYFVRPSLVGSEGEIRQGLWGGKPCTFLSDTGCTLEADSRPLMCKMLEPIPKRRASDVSGRHCKLHGDTGKQDACIAWIPYWNFLDKYE